jgi:hypothetical protein
MSVAFNQFDPETFRQRLTKMTDSELIRYGKAAKEMCKSHFGESPRETFVNQLQECREEWKRRHPKDGPAVT